MARQFVSASSQFFQSNVAVVTAVPVTFACWAYQLGAAASLGFMSIGHTTNSNGWILSLNSSKPTFISSNSAGSSTPSATTTNAMPTGQWVHLAGVSSAAASRAVYMNGPANKGTNTTSVTVGATMNRTTVGSNYNTGGAGSFMNGFLAEAAIWNVALTDGER